MSSTSIDNNKISYYGEDQLNLDGLIVNNNLNDLSYTSLLKISHCVNVAGKNLIVGQAAENSIDIDCAENINLQGHFGAYGATGHNVITVKGGCRDITLSGEIYTVVTTRKDHIRVGDWMDQSYKINKDIILNFSNQDKIYVAVGWAVPFSVKLKGNCKYLFWRSSQLKLYWLTKFIIRLIMRIPKGTKGPSWF